MDDKLNKNKIEKKAVPWYAYFALVITILFLSGALTDVNGPLKAIDFNNVSGNFGVMGVVDGSVEGEIQIAKDFKGIGGTGVKEGFLLALTVGPSIILAFGVIQIYNDYKGDLAAEKIFSPILKPLLGLPGSSALGIISSLTSADAGAGVASTLYENNSIDKKQLLIMTSFMFSAPAILVNFFMFTPVVAPYVDQSVTIALGIIILMKFVGAIVSRLLVNKIVKEEGI